MIDLDKAQLELSETQGWDPVLRVSGRVIRLRHPSRFQPVDSRKGLLPALGLLCARVWRLIFGGSEIAALRREVLAAVEEGETDSVRAVRSLGLWELTLVYRAVEKATEGLGERVAVAALAARASARAMGGGPLAVGKSEPVNVGSPGGESALTDGAPGQRLALAAGGGRLPGALGGGPLWGKAWVDANPEEAVRRLEERIERDRAAAEELRAKARARGQDKSTAVSAPGAEQAVAQGSNTTDAPTTAEVTHGG